MADFTRKSYGPRRRKRAGGVKSGDDAQAPPKGTRLSPELEEAAPGLDPAIEAVQRQRQAEADRHMSDMLSKAAKQAAGDREEEKASVREAGGSAPKQPMELKEAAGQLAEQMKRLGHPIRAFRRGLMRTNKHKQMPFEPDENCLVATCPACGRFAAVRRVRAYPRREFKWRTWGPALSARCGTPRPAVDKMLNADQEWHYE